MSFCFFIFIFLSLWFLRIVENTLLNSVNMQQNPTLYTHTHTRKKKDTDILERRRKKNKVHNGQYNRGGLKRTSCL